MPNLKQCGGCVEVAQKTYEHPCNECFRIGNGKNDLWKPSLANIRNAFEPEHYLIHSVNDLRDLLISLLESKVKAGPGHKDFYVSPLEVMTPELALLAQLNTYLEERG